MILPGASAAAAERVEAGEGVTAFANGSAVENPEERPAKISGAADDSAPPPFDEAAESAFLAEARDRGEVVRPPVATGSAGEEEEVSNGKPLPRMEELVNQIPVEVRDILEDLFRARFVTVKRIPKRALKS